MAERETLSMAKKRTKDDRSQRQSDRLEKRLTGNRREAAKRKAREDVNQAVERTERIVAIIGNGKRHMDPIS